ncbi:MAG TPA: RNA-binding protein [Methanosarcinales archaeon]|nr:RNA-binding protein [Methanosarcinales archaeon]
MNKKELYKLKSKSNKLESTIHIGKYGINNAVISELTKQLKKQKLIKIKILKTATENIDRNTLAKQLAELTNSNIIDIRGSTAVLYKK